MKYNQLNKEKKPYLLILTRSRHDHLIAVDIGGFRRNGSQLRLFSCLLLNLTNGENNFIGVLRR